MAFGHFYDFSCCSVLLDLMLKLHAYSMHLKNKCNQTVCLLQMSQTDVYFKNYIIRSSTQQMSCNHTYLATITNYTTCLHRFKYCLEPKRVCHFISICSETEIKFTHKNSVTQAGWTRLYHPKQSLHAFNCPIKAK